METIKHVFHGGALDGRVADAPADMKRHVVELMGEEMLWVLVYIPVPMQPGRAERHMYLHDVQTWHIGDLAH